MVANLFALNLQFTVEVSVELINVAAETDSDSPHLMITGVFNLQCIDWILWSVPGNNFPVGSFPEALDDAFYFKMHLLAKDRRLYFGSGSYQRI